MRSKTIPLFAYRKFEHQDGNYNCPFCDQEPDLMAHQLICKVLNKGLTWTARQQNYNIEDIYSSDIKTQVNILYVFEIIYKRRANLLKHFQTV